MKSAITIKGHYIAIDSFTAEVTFKNRSKVKKNGQKKQKTTRKVK